MGGGGWSDEDAASVGMAERLVRTDPEALIIAEDAGRVVGTVIVRWDGWRCHLYRLAVDPAHRRRGVATALIEAGIARAEATGAARIDAMVNPTNALGTAFWRASNFTLDEVERRWSLVVPPSSATPVPADGLVARPGADQRC